jgi:hypothetical protein
VSDAIPVVSQSGGTCRPPLACSRDGILQYACFLTQIHTDEHRYTQMILVCGLSACGYRDGQTRASAMRTKEYLCSSVCICVRNTCFLLRGAPCRSRLSCHLSGRVDPCRKCAAPIMRRAPLPLPAKRSNILTVTTNRRIASVAFRPVAERPTPSTGWRLTSRAGELQAVRAKAGLPDRRRQHPRSDARSGQGLAFASHHCRCQRRRRTMRKPMNLSSVEAA